MKKKPEKIWITYKSIRSLKIFMIMRIMVFLLLLGVIQVMGKDSYSQNTRVSLNLNDVTVGQVLNTIESQSEFYFIYNQKLVDVNRKVSVHAENERIDQVLTQLFSGTDIRHMVLNRQIVLSPKPLLVSSMDEVKRMQQQFTVTGTVKDEKGEVLPGVNIVEKGTTNGTISDGNGHYTLKVSTPEATLVFSFVGYKTQEVDVNKRSVVDVSLEEEAIGLQEVVTVGYGTQKKVNLTGAVSMVTSERLQDRPISSVGRGLQGVIPNLNITVLNGDPTQRAIYNIRGFESINGGHPLILVDGVPMDLERINPDDIQSVNVLKDASAAAVYGARAAYGVILVTTKKGQKGKVNVGLNYEYAWANPIFNMDPINDPYEYVTAYNIASNRTEGRPMFDDDYVEGTKAWSENPTDENAWKVFNGVLRFYGYNNYQHEIMTNSSPQMTTDLTISGGTDKANYYVSFGYFDKDGYLKPDPEKNEHFKRYNVLLKTSFKVNKILSLDEKIVFNSQVSDKPHFYNWDVNINSLARVSPIMRIQFPDLPYYLNPGDHDQFEQYIGMYFGGTNFFPYLLDGGRNTFTVNDAWFTQGITLNPVKGLKIRGDFSYNTYHRTNQDVASKVEIVSTNLTEAQLISNGFSSPDWIQNRSDYNQYYVLNAYAEYSLGKTTKHFFKAMIGFNQEWGLYQHIQARAYNLITPLVTDLNATTGTQQTWGGKSHLSLRGAFYRLNYIYKDRYLLEANGRYDGTSRFPKDDRFGFFPSFSAGWRLSNESFMAWSSNFLDNLKIRYSYGTLGNQMVPSFYPYISTMGIGMAPVIMDQSNSLIPMVTPPGLVSPTLTWETVASQNLGVDMTVLKQRLDFSFDIYSRATKNMLMNVHYPATLGTSAPKENAADLKTKGWELSLTWHDRSKVGNDWDYSINFNISDWTSKITKYENPTGSLSDYYVGKKLGEIWGYETVGIFQSDDDVAAAPDQTRLGANWKAGDIQYADLNHDGEITPGNNTLDDHGDLKVIGNSYARYHFGINGRVRYKGWSLNIFFQGIMKRDYWPSTGNWTWFFPFNSMYLEKYAITESWSEDNRDAYFFAPTKLTSDKKNIYRQSRYLQPAGYIRLKNLQLGYNLPEKWISKVRMSSAMIYVTGMNLWVHSKIHAPLDPETTYTGVIQYPMQHIYTIGAKIKF